MRSPNITLTRLITGAILLLGLSQTPSWAQDSTQIGLLEVSRDLLTIVAPESLRGEAEALLSRGAELIPRLENDLRSPLRQRVTIALIQRPIPSALAQLNSAAQPWAAGFMLPYQRLGAIRMDRTQSYPFDSTEMVLVHELTHLLVHDKVGREVPRWFDEAVATHQGRTRGARDLFFFTSGTLFGQTPSLASLDRGFSGSKSAAETSYAVSFEFLNWALKRHGHNLIPDVLDLVEAQSQRSRNPLDQRTRFEAAWQTVTGTPLAVSEQQWRRSAYRFSRWLPILLSSNWLWVAMALLSFLAFLAKRRQKLERYRQWEEQELAEALLISDAADESDDDQIQLIN